MHAVIRVNKLLQRGLGLLRRDAILLCIPAEGYQLVACKRVGQLRRSHGGEWQRPHFPVKRWCGPSASAGAGGKAAERYAN